MPCLRPANAVASTKGGGVTVAWLDRCHECDRPIVGGVFCADCLLIADVLASASSEPVRLLSPAAPLAGIGVAPASAPVTGSLDSAAGVHRLVSQGKSTLGASASFAPAPPAASVNKNTPTTSASQAGRRGAVHLGG